jgi:hypothetical protein
LKYNLIEIVGIRISTSNPNSCFNVTTPLQKLCRQTRIGLLVGARKSESSAYDEEDYKEYPTAMEMRKNEKIKTLQCKTSQNI